MKNSRIIISQYGGPECLQMFEEDLSPLKPNEVLIKVIAAGVAFGDVLKREGLIPGMPRAPYTPGYDLAGIIHSLGSGVKKFKVGDHVAAFLGNFCQTELAIIEENRLVKIPSSPAKNDAAIAVSLVLNYVSALQMLEKVAKVKKSESILIHGAAGGAGTAFLELAKLFELKVFGTASLGKHELVRSLGGIPIDYKNEDFVTEVQKHGGVDVVFDPIGGAHLKRSRAALKNKGRLVSFGAASSKEGGYLDSTLGMLRLGIYHLIPDGKSMHFFGISTWPRSSNPLSIRDDLERIMAWHAEGKLNPVIGARIPFKNFKEAYSLLEGAKVMGKIVLEMGDKKND